METENVKTKEQKEDETLWNALRMGDDVAFSRVYRKYVSCLFAYGMHFSADRELVKDCVQDTFIKIYKNHKQLGPTNNIKFYLYAALKNNLLNALQRTSESADIADYESVFTVDYSAHDTLVENETEENRGKHLAQVLELLSSRQKEVIHHRFIEELSFEEIAELMKMNCQSVQNLLQRSLKKIRKELKTTGVFTLFIIFILKRQKKYTKK